MENAVNQSLSRGLKVLIAVNESTPASVSNVVRQTGLAKATALRMLATLKNEGFIDFDATSGGYKTLPKARRLAGSMLAENTFLLAARQYLGDFAQSVKWPSDLLMPEGQAMVLQTSSRHVAPITLKRFEQSRFIMTESSSGLAYLAACSVRRRQSIISAVAELRADGAQESQIAEAAHRKIEAVRECGYAVKDYDAPVEGTRVVSVPVVVKGGPVGALALALIRDVFSDDHFDDVLMPKLRAAADEISELYVTHGAAETGLYTVFGEPGVFS